MATVYVRGDAGRRGVADIYIQHLRQHGRVTVADQAVQEVVNAFHEGAEPPR